AAACAITTRVVARGAGARVTLTLAKLGRDFVPTPPGDGVVERVAAHYRHHSRSSSRRPCGRARQAARLSANLDQSRTASARGSGGTSNRAARRISSVRRPPWRRTHGGPP